MHNLHRTENRLWGCHCLALRSALEPLVAAWCRLSWERGALCLAHGLLRKWALSPCCCQCRRRRRASTTLSRARRPGSGRTRLQASAPMRRALRRTTAPSEAARAACAALTAPCALGARGFGLVWGFGLLMTAWAASSLAPPLTPPSSAPGGTWERVLCVVAPRIARVRTSATRVLRDSSRLGMGPVRAVPGSPAPGTGTAA